MVTMQNSAPTTSNVGKVVSSCEVILPANDGPRPQVYQHRQIGNITRWKMVFLSGLKLKTQDILLSLFMKIMLLAFIPMAVLGE